MWIRSNTAALFLREGYRCFHESVKLLSLFYIKSDIKYTIYSNSVMSSKGFCVFWGGSSKPPRIWIKMKREQSFCFAPSSVHSSWSSIFRVTNPGLVQVYKHCFTSVTCSEGFLHAALHLRIIPRFAFKGTACVSFRAFCACWDWQQRSGHRPRSW